jgi:hypothetical protein
MFNCEGHTDYHGFQVEYVELSPFIGSEENQGKHSQSDNRRNNSDYTIHANASNNVYNRYDIGNRRW